MYEKRESLKISRFSGLIKLKSVNIHFIGVRLPGKSGVSGAAHCLR